MKSIRIFRDGFVKPGGGGRLERNPSMPIQ
jgi:hypothetical protein